jgi:hypothetical protein
LRLWLADCELGFKQEQILKHIKNFIRI